MTKLEVFDPKRYAFHRIQAKKLEVGKLEGRYGHTLVGYQQSLYVIGGQQTYDSNIALRRCYNDVLKYDIPDNSWKVIDTKGDITPRRCFISAMFGQFVVIYGGMDMYSDVLDDLVTLNLDTMQWNRHQVKRSLGKLAHSASVGVFLKQTINGNFKSIEEKTETDWGKVQRYIKEEGIYIFGG